ncbi:hypothetical protein [Nocardia brasiliensis]|uniref:hypothetical protein n=1 Tax=Nocardia brasiliensis TaxID=37326 RepID=UPI0018949BB3|nr:hypothetical protein [Nocardia brasiliensis]MBF6548885.1 hypothetical protein [Nocardia brasiliensis]
MPETTTTDVVIDPVAVDELARAVLAAPGDADLFVDRAAVIVQLAARVGQLRAHLHRALTEWVSLQFDYRQLRGQDIDLRRDHERLYAAAMEFATQLGLHDTTTAR